ncbi:MAG: IclR family transcriptional regulator [Actinomycetota bacterium]
MSLAQEAARRPARERSGVGVLDRSVAILEAVESGARTLSDLVTATGLNRATAHRLATALEGQELLTRLGGRGYRLGSRFLRLATTAMRGLPLGDLAHPTLARLARSTGESAQLYVRSGDERVCVDAVESASELRTIVPVGTSLTLAAGSAGKVFLAWSSEQDLERVLKEIVPLTPQTPTRAQLLDQLEVVRRRGWAQSAGERQAGVGSVSAPVRGPAGDLIAVVSVSGPETRMRKVGARRYAPVVLEAAREIERTIGVS